MAAKLRCVLVALAATGVVGPALAQQPEVAPPVATAADRAMLKHAIDIHAHLDPDSFGPYSVQARRRLDVIDMAYRAKQAGMRGFVVKQHYDQTAGIAYLAGKIVPGVEVFGQLCLNLPVGGLNPAAVFHFAEVKGGRARIVSMPTWDSENNITRSTTPNKPFVSVSQGGVLLPEAKAVIKAVATAKVRDSDVPLALSTGHVTAQEALMVIREARAQGIERIVVTHAMGHPVDMTIEQMKEAVRLGALIEFVAAFTVSSRVRTDIKDYYKAMRALGAEHVILSSDSGQTNRAYPDDMIAIVAGQLRSLGLTQAELHTMMVETPARLLGLPAPGARAAQVPPRSPG